jgi:hypothetical protein
MKAVAVQLAPWFNHVIVSCMVVWLAFATSASLQWRYEWRWRHLGMLQKKAFGAHWRLYKGTIDVKKQYIHEILVLGWSRGCLNGSFTQLKPLC